MVRTKMEERKEFCLEEYGSTSNSRQNNDSSGSSGEVELVRNAVEAAGR